MVRALVSSPTPEGEEISRESTAELLVDKPRPRVGLPEEAGGCVESALWGAVAC